MVWAGGSTAFGLPDMPIDRDDIQKKIKNNYFDFIINPNCWRIRTPVFKNLIVLDGEDHCLLHPRYLGRTLAYYKRELIWPVKAVRPIQFSLPDHLVDLTEADKIKKVHSSFSVYPGLRSDIAADYPSVIIEKWHDYIQDIKRSWFAISPKGAGYDCQRHYEIMGNAVLCIYLDAQAPKIMQDEFVNGINCLTFSTAAELVKKINECADAQELILRGRDALLKRHLSSCRAKQLLDDMLTMNMGSRFFPLYQSMRYGIYRCQKNGVELYRPFEGSNILI
jgi:hypothetical protein